VKMLLCFLKLLCIGGTPFSRQSDSLRLSISL